MKNPASPPFVAVFQAELLYNVKRVAPYALVILFGANAVLWWGWGAATYYGWATNSDYYILRNFFGFSMLTLPLFTALLMADPVIRDFRMGIDPLIFSKPISRAEYVLGKFFGNFFVLACCQAVFMLTLLLLQAFSVAGMVVLPARVTPYFKHFFFFVVVSNLALAAFCFTVGTLTRNVKVVYGLVLSLYPLYGAWVQVLKRLPTGVRIVLDPLLTLWGSELRQGWSVESLDQITVGYDGYMIANRALMVIISLALLTVLYVRFSSAERARKTEDQSQASILNLAVRAERLYDEAGGLTAPRPDRAEDTAARRQVEIPRTRLVTEGPRAYIEQFMAALDVEFRLLRAERSLVVIAPVAMLICGLELATYEVVPDPSYSAGYASRTAGSLLIFLFGAAVFYAGEVMHRDRELRVEPVLWSTPAPDFVLLLSKFSATFLLSLLLVALVALTAIAVQLFKGHAPFEPQAYLTTYAVILVPSIAFMIAASIALNVLLRDKYLAYAVSLAIGGGIFYLISQGYNHWLYNFVLYELWSPSDLLNGGSARARILVHRVYCLAISTAFIALAHFLFGRRSTKSLKAVLIMLASLAIAVVAGIIIGV